MNLCKVCGEETALFTEVYDPATGKATDIYMCPEHHRRLLETIRREIETMTADSLQPCPFCGSRKLHIYALDDGVRCWDCGAKITGVPDWRERWNRRVPA